MDQRRWRMRRTTRRQLVTAGLTVVAPIALGTAWPMRYLGRLYPGVTIVGLDLGGLTRAEAATQVQERLTPYLNAPITFRLDGQSWTASAADIGLRINFDATLDQACRHGRGAGVLHRYATLLDPADAHLGTSVVVEINETTLNSYFDVLNDTIAREPRDASLVVDGNSVSIAAEQIGRELDVSAMQEAVLNAVATLQPTDIPVATSPIEPEITAEHLAKTEGTVRTLLSDPVVVTHDDQRWTVPSEVLVDALVLSKEPRSTPALDHDVLIAQLAAIADEVNHPPRDATVAWDQGLYVTQSSYFGAEVDLKALATAIADAALTEERSVPLPLIYTPPEIDADNLVALGITQQLAVGSSSFAGSSESRSTNVRVAAEHVTQTLVAPRGTFSFNKSLGPISLDEGYVEGKIISGNWFADDLGGGVCQVSTTVFRAAFQAGLPFEEWHPHSFRLGFYELDGWSPGIDAAIYQPNTPDEWELDLVFANPTDAWLLLQMRVDGESIVAELYGAPTGYEVVISEPSLSDPIPPPAPIEQTSDNIPIGSREQIQTAQEGVEVSITRTIRRGREVVSKETFVSTYEPQPEAWAVGSRDAGR